MELQWANSAMRSPLPQALTQALKYTRALLSSTDAANRRRLSERSPPRKWEIILLPPFIEA
jgi:hypothetical protein